MTPDQHLFSTLASYYTPPEVAQVLTDWAILDADTKVLDPSFGGCAFLHAALNTLHQRGCPTPAHYIYGIDIDENARPYLKDLIDAGAKPEQFAIQDFFSVDLHTFYGGQVGAVVGNPPYIRYHDIPRDAQERAAQRLKEYGIKISNRASYWAFFLLYSMQFLRQDGRLAMILPGAFLHTNYSQRVRQLLREHFAEVAFILLQERIFDDTEEESVIVCASGARQPHRSARISNVEKVSQLERILKNIRASTRVLDKITEDGDLLRGLLTTEALNIYDQLSVSEGVIKMGDWIKAYIGVVTGNNRYFILSPREREQRGISRAFFTPIIRRSAHFKGLWVERKDLTFLATNGHRYLLLKTDLNRTLLPECVQRYIQYGETTGVSQAQKCRTRHPWYAVQNTYAPPAFMQCMSASWPRLIVNRSSYTCTNNILRVVWKKERPSIDWIRLALGTLSSLSQLSTELVGRSYGGGVLKVEPGELQDVLVPLIPSEDTKDLALRVDGVLRQGNLQEATQMVDEVLVESKTCLSVTDLEKIRRARDLLFLRRRRPGNNSE